MGKEQEKKNVIWNIIGATLNAFNSLVFTIIVIRINGTTDGGIFTYSFAMACLLYVVAVYLGRTFQVTDISNKYSDSDYIYNRACTCFIMIIFSLAFCILKGYASYKTLVLILLCLFKNIEAFSESIYAIIQKKGHLDQVGKSLAVKALIGVCSFLIIDLITRNLIASCLSVCIINVAILVLYDIRNAYKSEITITKFNKKTNILLFKAGFFTFILTFLSQYIINTSRYAIDDLLSDNFQTIFGIIIMPATFMALLGQFIIQPILTQISKCLKENQYDDLKKLVLKMVFLIVCLGIVVLIGVYLLGIPVLQFIYGIELSDYSISLMIIMLGAILYSIEILMSAVLIAMRKTEIQTLIFLLVSLISTIIAYILVKEYEVFGASISYFLTMLLISIVLIIYTLLEINKKITQ